MKIEYKASEVKGHHEVWVDGEYRDLLVSNELSKYYKIAVRYHDEVKVYVNGKRFEAPGQPKLKDAAIQKATKLSPPKAPVRKQKVYRPKVINIRAKLKDGRIFETLSRIQLAKKIADNPNDKAEIARIQRYITQTLNEEGLSKKAFEECKLAKVNEKEPFERPDSDRPSKLGIPIKLEMYDGRILTSNKINLVYKDIAKDPNDPLERRRITIMLYRMNKRKTHPGSPKYGIKRIIRDDIQQ